MPFTSNAQKFFNRFGPAQSEPLTNTLQPAKFAFDSAALKSANLFDTINKVRQNEMERQAKQVMIAKALAELQQVPQENQLRQAQIQKALYEADPSTIEKQLALQKLLSDIQLNQAKESSYKNGRTGIPRFIRTENGDLVEAPGIIYDSPEAKAKLVEKESEIRGKASVERDRKQSVEKARRLTNVLISLAEQYDEAYKTSENPLAQRISGKFQQIGAKTGIVSNPKIVAIDKNMEFLAPQIVRLAGDVGAIPEQQTMRVIKSLASGGLTKAERKAQVDSFVKFALSNSSKAGIEQPYDEDKEARYQAWKAQQLSQ